MEKLTEAETAVYDMEADDELDAAPETPDAPDAPWLKTGEHPAHPSVAGQPDPG